MRAIIAILLLTLVGCKSQPHAVLAATSTNAGPATAINVTGSPNAGSAVLGGDPSTPIYVAPVSGGLSDGGTNTGVLVLNDAGNPVPFDMVPGDLLNTSVIQNTPGIQQIIVDAGTRFILSANWTNEGTITGYAQIYCGQYVPDAGGTAGAATVPTIQVRCPAGTICGTGRLVAPVSCAGGAWYSSVDAGFLLGTSAPALTLTAAAIR